MGVYVEILSINVLDDLKVIVVPNVDDGICSDSLEWGGIFFS